MSALREFQTGFRAFLVGAGASADASPAARHIKAHFAANAGIYRNNVRHAHAGALAAIYPATMALVGEGYFDALARSFADRFPPTDAVLANYGDRFAGHLETRTELAHASFLPDVAQLEWAVNRSFHAHSSSSLSPGQAAALFAQAGDADGLRLLPSARLVSSRYPVRDIRGAALAGDAAALERLGPAEQHLLVFRPERDVRIEVLTSGEAAFLRSIANGAPLDEAIAGASGGDTTFSPAEAIGKLLHLGVFLAPTQQRKGTDQ